MPRSTSFASLFALAAPLLVTSVSQAQAMVAQFDLPAQPLALSLRALGSQTSTNVLFDPPLVEGRDAPELRAELTLDQAFARILAGTGLKHRFLDGKTVMVIAAATAERVRATAGLPDAGLMRLAQAEESNSQNPEHRTAEESQDRTAQSGAFSETAGSRVEEVLVTGSQIRNAPVGALSVSTISAEDIASEGFISGEELFRSIPQLGDVSFNSQSLRGTTSGVARGDVSSINLRGLGAGNTLVLLNGRRMVKHPTTQGNAEFTYNANTIPVGALDRVEVLLDGAAAIYGADAVAGVVNNVMKADFDGLSMDAQFGGAEGTNMRQLQINLTGGLPFAGGRGNVTTFVGYTHDTELYASDQDFTASDDKRPLLAGTSFEGNPTFDARDTTSPWGVFRVPASAGIVRSNGVALNGADGLFHIQPSANPGCQLALGNGTCIDDGNLTGAADRNLRSDQPRAVPDYTISPSVTRANVFSVMNLEINDELTLFGELGYYNARTEAVTAYTGVLGSTPITIPADSYYNPFGPVGSPNRLPGLNIPDAGIPLTLVSYRIGDAGRPRTVEVSNDQYRILAGLRGSVWNWDWESAALYSEASVKDREEASVSNTLFQQALSRSTPDAYNPFNGGDPANPSLADITRSSEVNSFLIPSQRRTESSLALWDLKLSRSDLFSLPGGPVGIAVGAEVRRETSEDIRDPNLDFSTPFIDSVTGRRFDSNTLGASSQYSISGDRVVTSAYMELAVPVISAGMSIPLVHKLDLQLAGRYEDFDDVGDVTKPKLAVAWDVVDGVRLRSSWSEGFKAPTLEQLVPITRPTVFARLDDVLCEADLRAGRIANFGACAQRPNVQRIVAGNPDLQPEESESFSYGVVLDAMFIPERFGALSLSVDHWKIEQEGKVSIVSAENAITLDYLRRVQGSFNPDVVRAAPTAADIAFVAGTGLAPIGSITAVNVKFDNLDPRTIEGIDFAVNYRLSGTPWGDLSFNVNAARTLEYFQSTSALQRELLSAQAAGIINSAALIGGAVELLETAPLYPETGQPKWKGSARVNWSNENWSAGASSYYVGRFFQRGATNATGQPWEVESLQTVNLQGEYRFLIGPTANAGVRVGVRNVADKQPPVALNGYLGTWYQPYARYWYLNVHTNF